MKRLISALALLCLLLPSVLFAAEAEGLAQRLQGRILLQVEQRGEAWFVHEDGNRYYLKNGSAAYEAMRSFGLGISNADLDAIPAVASVEEYAAAQSVCAASSIAARLAGKILLQVEDHGEAWYVDPPTCRRVYMRDGEAAYAIMRLRGLGITDADLEKIPTGFLASSACDVYRETDDGVVHAVLCEGTASSTSFRVYAEENRVTGQDRLSIDIAIPTEDQWTQQDGRQVSIVPFITQLMCFSADHLVNAQVFALTEEGDAAPNVSFSMTIRDAGTGEPLASCESHTGTTISYTDHQGLTAEQSLGGIVLGEPVDMETLFDLLFSEALADLEDLFSDEAFENALEEAFEGFGIS